MTNEIFWHEVSLGLWYRVYEQNCCEQLVTLKDILENIPKGREQQAVVVYDSQGCGVYLPRIGATLP